MASLLNNDGVQYYSTQMVKAENRKVNGKPLPSVLNEIDVKLDEMKTLFDEEYGTALDMKLENNENVFSVGTGTDINKKDEVENGFTDIEISGNSLVNLVSSEIKSMTSTRTSGWHQDRSYKYSDMIKPNTTYTIVCQVLKNTLSTPFGMGGSTKTYNQLNFNTFKNFAPKETGIKISVVQSYDEWDKTQALILFPQFGNRGEEEGLFEIGETIEYRFMIFEGDYSNNPPTDFFQGLKSVGEKEDGNNKLSISSVSKNLWGAGKQLNSPAVNVKKINNHSYELTSIQDGNYKGTSFDFTNLEPNVKYIIHAKTTTSNGGQSHIGVRTLINGAMSIDGFNSRSEGSNICSFSFKKGIKTIRINIYATNGNTTSGTVLYENLQLEKYYGEKTEFEEYKIDKKEISLNEPLRSLPNGVKDTIEKINGEWKIIRRCVEVTIDGNETSWNRNVNLNGTEVLFFYINTKISTSLPEGAVKTNADIVHIQCNSFPCYALKDRTNNKSNNIDAVIYSDGSNPLIQFHVNKSRLISEDFYGFKHWLSQNPTKVIYELATPIIEDIEPLTLQYWKNGTISIDEVLPVESTHTVSLNKPAQIKRNIEELTTLRNKVQALEENYDQIALEQAHQLNLLSHSIELDYDI